MVFDNQLIFVETDEQTRKGKELIYHVKKYL